MGTLQRKSLAHLYQITVLLALTVAVASVPSSAIALEAPAASVSEQGQLQSPNADANAIEEKSGDRENLEWKFAWEGWNGLNYSVIKHIPQSESEPGQKPGFFDLSKIVFRGKFGGRFAGDGAVFWNEHDMERVEDGFEVRRARVYWTGEVVLLRPWSFSLEAGITGGKFTLDESYLLLSNFKKLGVIQAGQFKAPMSIEAIMSARDLTFMESSSSVMALAPGYSTGIQLGRPAFSERMTWAIGFFTNTPVTEMGDATRKAKRVMGRVTWLALDGAGGGNPSLLHIGFSASHLFAGEDFIQYRSRPESHLAPYMVDTGEIRAQSSNTFGLEGAYVRGPFSLQGEFLQSWVNKDGADGSRFWGSYLTASFLLTGESRPYSRSRGIFTRLNPGKPLSRKGGGRGALELAARCSVIDLNSGSVHGGKMRSLTAGLNWYMNANLKCRLNWVAARSDRPGPMSRISIAEMRLEFDF